MNDHDLANILMVDDSPGKLMSYRVILEELGENLIQARSAREALDQLLRQDIAVVLMDVSMPEIDGFELADMMRKHPRFQKIPIIFISAVHLTDLDRIKGYRSGRCRLHLRSCRSRTASYAKVSVFAELHRKNRQLERLNSEGLGTAASPNAQEQLRESEELLRERADLARVGDRSRPSVCETRTRSSSVLEFRRRGRFMAGNATKYWANSIHQVS